MASIQFLNDPRHLIGDYLTSQGYAYDTASAEIVTLGPYTYELIDPPLEPLTGTPLAKWQLYPLGHFVYYAAPLDLPPLRTIDLHLTLTEDDYGAAYPARRTIRLEPGRFCCPAVILRSFLNRTPKGYRSRKHFR